MSGEKPIFHQTMTQNLQESVHRDSAQTRVVGADSEPGRNRRMARYCGSRAGESPRWFGSCLTNPHASQLWGQSSGVAPLASGELFPMLFLAANKKGQMIR